MIEGLSQAGWPGPGPDRWLAPEIEAAVEYVGSGQVIADAEAALGKPLS